MIPVVCISLDNYHLDWFICRRKYKGDIVYFIVSLCLQSVIHRLKVFMGLIDESYFRSESLNLTSRRESFYVHCAPNWTMHLFSILTHNNFVGKYTVVQLYNEFQAKYPRHPGGGCLEKKVILTWIGQTRCYYFHMTNTMPPLYPIIVSKKGWKSESSL